jgi:signal transduction histidine kinase/CheY-like chemotaxis protein
LRGAHNFLEVPSTERTANWISAPAFVGVATLADFWIQAVSEGRAPFVPFFPALIATGFLAGTGPGIFALMLSTCAAWLFWTLPTGHLLLRASDLATLAMFLLCGAATLAISVFARRLVLQARRTRESLDRALQVTREAEQRKDEFLATLAHELRNPMAPIRYAAASLRQGMPEHALQHAREVIERQGKHMARLLDDLMDVSRITRNVVELKRALLDLRIVVEEVAETAKPLLTNLQHRLILSIPPNPLWVFGDAARLRQVIGNLLDNAAKYTEPGGSIEICLDTADGQATMRFKDTGIGLAPEMIPRLFEMFTQLHKSQGVTHQGLGIGLTVVKRLVELHDGTIEVSSEGLHRGTQFTVRLPLASNKAVADAELAPQTKVAAALNSRPHVLIVDDNADAAQTLADLIRLEGFPVTVAFDGGTALSAFERIHPAVVLLDMGLPDMSGTEVARRMRSHPHGKSIQIIAVTGWGQSRDREQSQAAGVDLHLVKPVDPAALLHTLNRRINELASLG